jgi:hypothetical protein
VIEEQGRVKLFLALCSLCWCERGVRMVEWMGGWVGGRSKRGRDDEARVGASSEVLWKGVHGRRRFCEVGS